MEYNLDEYKINNNKLFISGWVHGDDYIISVIADGEEKKITNYESRYDICMKYHEKIEDNHYGFKEEINFTNTVKYVQIFLEYNNQKEMISIIDERKVASYIRKIRKVLGKIKRGISFLWREYHFLVPPTMFFKYVKDIFKGKEKKQVYNPEIDSEYQAWFRSQSIEIDKIHDNKDLEILNVDDKNIVNNIRHVTRKYICIQKGEIEFSKNFYSSIEDSLNNNYDLIYFDNDHKENNHYCKPLFKPDFSPDTLLGVNYVGNCFIIRAKVLKKILGDDKAINLYQVLLSFIGKDYKINHIPKILYHDLNSIQNEKKIVEKYLKENHIHANVKVNPDKITNTIEYIPSGKSFVSIIIPTKDHSDILQQCLESIYQKTTYKNYEIIVIDNNSCEQETFDLLEEYDRKYDNFHYKRIECEFNYSYLNNEAVKISKGDYVLLLNNDIEVITPEWLERMLGYAEQKHVGTVGAKLIFPDETIQHAGIIMGKGGLAGHAHYAKDKNYQSMQYELKIPYNYSACTAACLLISKKKYEEVNGLEEKLKVAFNDVDLNLKVLSKGYYNVFLPNVELYHYESKSRGLDTSPEKQKRFIQEWSLISDKWNNYIEHDPFYNDNFSKDNEYKLIGMENN